MSTVLLDTHAMLWFFWDDSRLSSRARHVIEDAENRKMVSVASCWEIAIKVGLGKLNLGESSRSFLPREIARNNFELLPISISHVTAVGELIQHHRDPFDRLLVTQTMTEGVSLVSADVIFDQYGIARVW